MTIPDEPNLTCLAPFIKAKHIEIAASTLKPLSFRNPDHRNMMLGSLSLTESSSSYSQTTPKYYSQKYLNLIRTFS